MRFAGSNVVDSGETERVYCVAKTEVPAVTPDYTWEITKPDGTTVNGSSPTAPVVADQPGTYSCTFTATANRDCPPPDYTIGPATATAATPALTAGAIAFTNSGAIKLWPTGDDLSPPPGGWHYDADNGGARYPVRYPFAGQPGAEPVMDVKFRVTQNEVCDSVRVRATVATSNLGEGSIDITGAVPFDRTLTGIGGSAPIPEANAIMDRSDSVTFDCSTDQGVSWFSCGSGRPLRWYIMKSLDTHGEVPYDLGLDKVVEYAAGQSTASGIATNLNTGIAAEIWYDPQQQDPADHILHVYETGRAQCSGNAKLLAYLSKIAGIQAEVLYLWGGSSASQFDFYCYGGWAGPSFRTPAPANDGAVANPHFTFHAEVSLAGGVYDPSYGSTGEIVFDEVCPSYSLGPNLEVHIPPIPGEPAYVPMQRTGGSLPSISVTVPCAVWSCPHSP